MRACMVWDRVGAKTYSLRMSYLTRTCCGRRLRDMKTQTKRAARIHGALRGEIWVLDELSDPTSAAYQADAKARADAGVRKVEFGVASFGAAK